MLFSKKLKVRRVVGQSMHPSIKDGSMCLFLHQNKYKVNDIVLINSNGKDFVKKIEDLNNKSVRLISDDYFGLDSRVWGRLDISAIKAKLIFRVPFF